MDEVADPGRAAGAERLDRPSSHLHHLREIVDCATQRLLDPFGVGGSRRVELRLEDEAAQRQRRLGPHACRRVALQEADQRIDQIAPFVLPEPHDSPPAHLRLAVTQRNEEDSVEVQIDIVLRQIAQRLDQALPAVRRHLQPAVEERGRLLRPHGGEFGQLRGDQRLCRIGQLFQIAIVAHAHLVSAAPRRV